MITVYYSTTRPYAQPRAAKIFAARGSFYKEYEGDVFALSFGESAAKNFNMKLKLAKRRLPAVLRFQKRGFIDPLCFWKTKRFPRRMRRGKLI